MRKCFIKNEYCPEEECSAWEVDEEGNGGCVLLDVIKELGNASIAIQDTLETISGQLESLKGFMGEKGQPAEAVIEEPTEIPAEEPEE